MPETRGALDGITVVDCSSYLAGPYGAMMLADLGASVIKVESLEGDSFRELPGFYGWNRGKRSVAVNLKEPAGREVLHRLVKTADVVMENMRPGVVERLGVDSATLRALNPRLIYCAVTAFGPDGPYRDRPGYDPVLQAMGGVSTCRASAARPSSCGWPSPTTTRPRSAPRPCSPPSSCASARGAASTWRRPCSRACSRCSPAASSTIRASRRFSRDADLPAVPGRRWRVVLPRLRQSVLLGQALQGARPARDDRRSALRLLAPPRRQSRRPHAAARGGLRVPIPRRVAHDPERARHPLRARPVAPGVHARSRGPASSR